jgi:hypothetical protein
MYSIEFSTIIKRNSSVKPWQHAQDRDEGSPPPSQFGNKFGVIRDQHVPTQSKGCFKIHIIYPICLILTGVVTEITRNTTAQMNYKGIPVVSTITKVGSPGRNN